MKQVKNSRFTLVILLLILGLGAFLRLYRIADYMTFLGDEGRDVLIVKRFIVDGDIPFIGPTASVGGFFLGPLYYYLMAPALFLSQLNPVGPAIMVALFGVATIYLVYKIGSVKGTLSGFIAASLYAVSPLVIAQSRSSWNPNVVPFFAALYIYSLLQIIEKKKHVWYVATGISIGAGVQLHYLFIFLIPVGIFVISYYERSIKKIKEYLLFILGLIIPLFPFLAFEVKNHFPNTQTVIRFISEGGDVAYGGNIIMKLSGLIFRLYSRLLFFFPPPEQITIHPNNIYFWWRLWVVVTIFVTIGLLMYLIWKKKDRYAMLLMSWLVFGIGMFSFYQKAIYDYYLTILFPFPFLVFGLLVSSFWKNLIARAVLLVSFIGLLAVNISGQPFQHPPNRQLAFSEEVSRFVFEKTEGKPFNFALITISNSDHAFRYFFEIWGNPPVTIENSMNDPQRTTVTDQLLVICDMYECKPLGHSLWEIAGFGQAQIVGEWQMGYLKVYKLVHVSS